MKAVRVYGWGGPVKVEEVPEPIIGDREVLIRVKAALLGTPDWQLLRGITAVFKDPEHFVFPHTPTLRGAGVVERIGSRVSSLVPGDRVVINSVVNCRCCTECYSGRDNHCNNVYVLGSDSTHHGVMAEMVKVPEWSVYKLPESVSLCQATLLSDTSLVVHAIDHAAPKPGFTMAIFGCGRIGSIAISVAHAYGPAQLICIDTQSDALQLAPRLGANVTFDARQVNVPKAIKALTSKGGVDVALVTATSAEPIQDALRSVVRGGMVVLLGIPTERRVALVFEDYFNDVIARELTIKGTFGKTQEDFRRAVALVATNQIDLSLHGFEEYDSLEQYEEAARMMITLGPDKRPVVFPFGEF